MRTSAAESSDVVDDWKAGAEFWASESLPRVGGNRMPARKNRTDISALSIAYTNAQTNNRTRTRTHTHTHNTPDA